MTVYNITDPNDGHVESGGTNWEDHDNAYASDAYFNVGDKAGTRTGGLRFTGITETGTVATATLSVMLWQAPSKSMTITVYADDKDDAATWSDTSNPDTGSFTDTTASATINVLGTESDGDSFDVDVKTIVQEIFDRPGWGTSQAIRFALRYTAGSPTYNQVSFRDEDGVQTGAATLEITTGAAGSAVPNIIQQHLR